MLNRDWIPTGLIDRSERPEIPIVDGAARLRFRAIRVGAGLILLCLKLLGLKLTGRLEARKAGRLIGDFCQRMGVLWIKVGQLISMRSDIFPRELCAELAKLQERAEGFSPRLAREIISRELGAPIEEIFSRFRDQPWAAASIAQVHRARLREPDIEVAIKVRRPGIEEIFHRDMALVSFMFRSMVRFSIMPHMRWEDMLWELGQVFTEELDYRYEISNQQRLRDTLTRHRVYVPKVFPRYCTPNIIVMEFVAAVSMTDYIEIGKREPERLRQWLAENDIDPEVVFKRLLHSFLRQLMEDNLFHADLHPGNIFLLRENRIALLDFGSVGTNEMDMLRKYDAFLETLSQAQYAKAVDIFLLIMPDLPPANLVTVREELQRSLHAWGDRCRVNELPYKEKSTSFVFDEMTRIMARYGVDIIWALFKVLRGWGTLDASLSVLNPKANLVSLTRDYTRERRKRELGQVMLELPRDILGIQKLIDYPREISEMAIYRGAMVRRLAQVFEGTATRVSKLAAVVFGIGSALSFVAVALAAVILLTRHAGLTGLAGLYPIGRLLAVVPRLDGQVWLLLMALLLYSWLALAFLARRFRRQD